MLPDEVRQLAIDSRQSVYKGLKFTNYCILLRAYCNYSNSLLISAKRSCCYYFTDSVVNSNSSKLNNFH